MNDGSRRDAVLGATAAASPDVIAAVLLDGFDRHYALFRDCARAAKRHFEAGNWLAIRHVARDRIDFYDRRVAETVERSSANSARPRGRRRRDALWERVKRHFIGLLIDHRQPECAETFFNSVSCKILHRDATSTTASSSFARRSRPSTSTPTRLPTAATTRAAGPAARADRHRARLRARARASPISARDLRNVLAALPAPPAAAVPPRGESPDPGARRPVLPQSDRLRRRPHRQRRHAYPFVVAIKHDADGRLYVDALLIDQAELALLFSANRAYFLVDMEVPSGVRRFPARDRCPTRPPPSSTRWSACRSTARRSSSATSCTTSRTRATGSSSRRASRVS